MAQPLHTHSSPRALPQGFSIYQPAPGAQVQFFPALGSQELDDLLHAYLPGPNSISDKRAAVTIDFFQQSQIDGQSFRFYQVDAVDMVTHAPSPSTASSSPAQSSSSSQSSFPATPAWDFSNISDAASMRSGKSSAKVRKTSKASSSSIDRTNNLGSLPGMKIMTKDGLDVTNSASRGSKTKEQRDHAHMMRIMKACDSCRAKKVRCDPSHKRHSSTAAVPATSTRAATNRTSKSTSKSPASSQPSPMPMWHASSLSGLSLPAAPSTAKEASLSSMADFPSFENSVPVADDFVFDDALWNELMAGEHIGTPAPDNMAAIGFTHTDMFSTQSSTASSSGSSSSPGMGPYYSDLSQSSTQASSPTDAATSRADASSRMPVPGDGTISPSLLLDGAFDVSASECGDASQMVCPRMDRSAATQDILDATIVAPDDGAAGGETARTMLRNTTAIHTRLGAPEGVVIGAGHTAALANMQTSGTEVSANTADDESSPQSMVAHAQLTCSSSSARRTLEHPGRSVVDEVDAEAGSALPSSSAAADEPEQVSASVVALGGDKHIAAPEPMRERQQWTEGDDGATSVSVIDSALRSDTGTETDRPCGTEDIIATLPPLSSAVYLASTLLWQFSLAMHSQASKSPIGQRVHLLPKGSLYAANHVRGTSGLRHHTAQVQAVC